ncbi:hypothetical protein ABGN05_14690 [Aquibium sp. LZ166]|uniref:Uncharacterized protein n=1 Tax=Aquibium pacificus TaxID=3153579 RepID=A0ABV3SJM3_9HYPH
MDVLDRIRALPGAPTRGDAALESADMAYRQTREAARYARDDVKACEADDRECGLLQSSLATDRAQAVLDAAEAAMRDAWAKLDAERKRYGKLFLRDMTATADAVAAITAELAKAVDELRDKSWAIAKYATANHLPLHRSIDHAASLDEASRRLRFQ